MDPNATLRQMLLNANIVLVKLQQIDKCDSLPDAMLLTAVANRAEVLANAVLDMNTHLRDGGCLPDAWSNRATQHTS